MRIPPASDAPSRARRGAPRRAHVGLALLAAWSLLVFAIGAATHASGFWGIYARPLLEAGWKAPARWIRAQLTTPPRLEIDVKFEDFQKLSFHRERALAQRALFASSEDAVPATIRSGDENVKVDIRLKGDSIAHLQGEKWSFRVDVKRSTLLGLQRFSLQHPATRGYLSEWVYHRALEREDVLGLRYEFVDVTLNGKHLGVYALEEHFEKQLVEQRQRRAGPLLRFDEELMWRELHAQAHPFGSQAMSGYGAYEASAIDGFRTDKMLADPASREAYLHAVRLLERFRRGELRTDEVFDTTRLAKYFALTDLLGADHGARWHNMRFYFNPITMRLEPIGFDAECEPLEFPSAAQAFQRDADGRLVPIERGFHDAIFADRDFYRAYVAELERVAAPAYLDALERDLAPGLAQAQRVLHREFPQAEPPYAMLRRNQQLVRSWLEPVAGVRAHLRGVEGGALALELGNLQSLAVEVLGVELPAQGGAGPTVVDWPAPLVLEPRRIGALVRFAPARVALPDDAEIDAPAARVRWRILGTQTARTTAVTPYSPLAGDAGARDATHAKPNLDAFPFVSVDVAAGRARIQPGSWAIERDLVAPPGVVLHAGPGTRLDLRRGAKIVSRSPLEWRGSAEAPVELLSSDATGEGLVVLSAGGESVLEHVRFAGLRNVDDGGWTLTGAVTFYESPVTLLATEFAGNVAEDAFNAVRSRVRIDGSVFRDASSDAFDCDFCEVVVTNTRFERLVNDGIDVSGSTASIDNVIVEGAGDKGVSVGEASDLVAGRLVVIGSNVGVASKDRSTLVARDVTVRDCKWGIAAFEKKPEFGPAQVRIEAFASDPPNTPHLIQLRSQATVAGAALPPSDQQNVRAILYGESDSVAVQR
jgi:hypothetical protein